MICNFTSKLIVMYRLLASLIMASIVIQHFHAEEFINISFDKRNVNLQSVQVKNITKGITVNLLPKNTLQLRTKVITSTKQLSTEYNHCMIIPNPLQDHADIFFSNPTPGVVTMTVTNLEGKTMCSLKLKLSNGTHIFKLSGLPGGIYLMHIQTAGVILKQKIISTNTNYSNYSLEYSGISFPVENAFEPTQKIKSSDSDTVIMDFDNPDKLQFTGKSAENTLDSIFISPAKSQTILFEFPTPGFPQLADTWFYSDYFDFEQNVWRDKSGNENHAHLVQSNCGTVKTSSEMTSDSWKNPYETGR